MCSTVQILYQFMLTEALVVQVFQQCFTEEKKKIIFYLMQSLYKRIQFDEDDDNLDAELRKRVFHCLRRYTETMKDCFKSDEIIFARKVFLFIVKFYISLIEERNITNFEELFETKCRLYHQETIFHSKVRNSSLFIMSSPLLNLQN